MKKFLLMLLMLALACAASVGLADGEGVIVQSACNIMPSDNYYLVYCFAQVHNNSDSIICLNQGRFELHNGEQLLCDQEITRMWPYFLNPGEDGYFFDVVYFEPDEKGNPVLPSITAIDYNVVYMTVDQAFAGYDLSAVSEIVIDADHGTMSVECEITNATDMAAYDPVIAFGLYTEDDRMIYADGMMLTGIGIPAGGTVLVRFAVDEAFVQQWGSYGVRPAQAHVNASFRRDED